MFENREQAGHLLAGKLKKYRNDPGIVLAVPRGGIPVAYIVAKELGLPMDVILTKKIGHPVYKEYAIGAASLTDYFVIPHKDVSTEYIQEELVRIRKRLREMQKRFRGDAPPQSFEGKTVIIIDDGIATGNTVLATIEILRKSNPAKIVIAAPVAPQTVVDKLSDVADDVVIVDTIQYFHGVGAYYYDFEQVTDDEVMFYLDKIKELKKAG